MEVRAKKALGQHFLTDKAVADRIVESLGTPEGMSPADVLEIGPGTGVLTERLLARKDVSLKAVEIDRESVTYLREHYPALGDSLIEGDFLKLDPGELFAGNFLVIGNFPYNISSQIFFRILDFRERIPEVVCAARPCATLSSPCCRHARKSTLPIRCSTCAPKSSAWKISSHSRSGFHDNFSYFDPISIHCHDYNVVGVLKPCP